MFKTSKKSHREVMPKAVSADAKLGKVLGKIFGSSRDWQLQTAKAKFSEVFRLARTQGPQRITRQGKEGVVMISDEQYKRLLIRSHQPKSIVQFFRESPLVGLELDLERGQDTGRDIEL